MQQGDNKKGTPMFDFKTTRAFLFLRNVANGDMKRKDCTRREACDLLDYMENPAHPESVKRSLAALTIPNMVKIHKCLRRG